ncbi:TIGR02594 family protein [Bradyrhizobium erythrophlei]|uniref:TIGR02594 family protein n=1 Tax=Bradyrhizobium erythrophlei TaxID=1437360 RepID=A0A1H4NZ95_9BRAD|nr:TIGR02594 family protein [Bradyrhizobium erythrophlei]SEC00012.1 TIGR02594 family protein [Bradyrhizobium erythrophlei]
MTIAALVAAKPLRMGASGDAVKQVQLALKSVGYALTGTGWFGPATDTAVETFQKRAGLYVDGEVGPLTGAALDLAVAGKVPVPAPAKEIGRPLWLEAGIKLIGTKEGVGSKDNPVIIDWAKDEGGDIAAEYTHDSIPWCALFANHILTKVGLKGTKTLWALDFAGNWPAVKLAGPAVGAFAPMKRTGGGHIMVVVGKDQHRNVMGLGGNQSDAVNIGPFATSRLNQGFWWPKDVPPPPASQIGFNHLPVVRSDGRVSTNEA